MKLFTGRAPHRHNNPHAELARLRAAYTNLCSEQGVSLGRQLDAMERIDQLTADRSELTERLATAMSWASDADAVNACLTQTNAELTAENARLRAELAALKAPVARVLPLQQRGPNAA